MTVWVAMLHEKINIGESCRRTIASKDFATARLIHLDEADARPVASLKPEAFRLGDVA
jgi:hypothetical protein